MLEPMFAEASAEGRAGAATLQVFAKGGSDFFESQLTSGIRKARSGASRAREFRKECVKALFIVCGKMPG